jgi:NAD(P)-dependent dehydrogenase (short-subunit alcohol dehydrogenase family)
VLLESRHAVIYGGGGAIGGAIAVAMAREGADVHLAGRTPEHLDAVAEGIRAAGGVADTAVVDALDEGAVNAYVDNVAASAGAIDISCNVISRGDVQGTPLVEMSIEDFEAPVITGLRTQFITAKAAARHMVAQGSGVILMFGGTGGRDPLPPYVSGGFQVYMGGSQVAFGAVDVLRRQLAQELGPNGIRVLTIESAGVPETIPGELGEIMTEGLAAATMLKRAETLEDVGNAAVFAASDLARNMTATSINITGGRQPD